MFEYLSKLMVCCKGETVEDKDRRLDQEFNKNQEVSFKNKDYIGELQVIKKFSLDQDQENDNHSHVSALEKGSDKDILGFIPLNQDSLANSTVQNSNRKPANDNHNQLVDNSSKPEEKKSSVCCSTNNPNPKKNQSFSFKSGHFDKIEEVKRSEDEFQSNEENNPKKVHKSYQESLANMIGKETFQAIGGSQLGIEGQSGNSLKNPPTFGLVRNQAHGSHEDSLPNFGGANISPSNSNTNNNPFKGSSGQKIDEESISPRFGENKESFGNNNHSRDSKRADSKSCQQVIVINKIQRVEETSQGGNSPSRHIKRKLSSRGDLNSTPIQTRSRAQSIQKKTQTLTPNMEES